MIAWRNQISLSLFGFSIISSRRSTLSGALAPALTRSSVLHRGWQQQPHNYNEAGLMWWQDRLPALLSLSFVPGLHGVPALIIMSVYLHCTERPQNTPLPLFTSAYRGQQAFKLQVRHLYSFTICKERFVERVWSTFLFIQLYTFTPAAAATVPVCQKIPMKQKGI